MVEPVYSPVVALAKGGFAALGLSIDIQGAHNVPESGGAIIASNHIGYLDFIFAGLGARPSKRFVRFMAKESIWHSPVAGPLMRGMKHIPVDRDAGAESFRVALNALRAGEIVGIFPEATISRSFEIKDFKVGAVRLAQQAGVPVIPCVLWGTQRIMTKGRPRDISRGKAISITMGAPISVGRGDDAEVIGNQLHATMAGMLEDTIARYPQHPAGPDDSWWMPQRLGGTAPTLAEATRMDRREAIDRARQAPSP
ncbi:MAG: lysophospholipid acyltransferase family protein [Actinomycetes bacterium]